MELTKLLQSKRVVMELSDLCVLCVACEQTYSMPTAVLLSGDSAGHLHPIICQ